MTTPAELILSLRAAGLTDAEIAVRCNTTQPTIWRIATGVTRDPRYSIVRDLLDLRAAVAVRDEVDPPADGRASPA